MKVVLDASCALALAMPDGSAPASAAAVLARDLLAPFIWPVEVANAARHAIRRKCMTFELAQATTVAVQAIGVSVQPEMTESVAHHFQPARSYGLSPWDALYVDLALKGRHELATKDAHRIAVATRLGITVHQ